jgi:hypothetical protein
MKGCCKIALDLRRDGDEMSHLFFVTLGWAILLILTLNGLLMTFKPLGGRCVDGDASTAYLSPETPTVRGISDVDALDAVEIPRLGIERHFGWGLSQPVPET